MSIITNTNEIECTGLDTDGIRQTFTITILERHLKHLIVRKGKKSKLMFNKAERSLRRQTTGRLLYVGVLRTTLNNRFLR